MTFFSILSILLLVAIGIVMAIAVIVLLFQAGRGIGFIFEHVFEFVFGMLLKLGVVTLTDVLPFAKLFEQMDTDQSGYISTGEFMRFARQGAKHEQARSARAARHTLAWVWRLDCG